MDILRRISFFKPSIKIMFQNSKKFLISVEFIINNLTEIYEDSLSYLIPFLASAPFHRETVEKLLSNHLMKINSNTLRNLNLSEVSGEIVEKALFNRASDFVEEQIITSNIQDSKRVSQYLKYTYDENIPQFKILNEMPNILTNYLVDKKLDKLSDSQIQQIIIGSLYEKLKISLLSSKISILEEEQINQYNVENLDNSLLNELVTKRTKDLSVEQTNAIKVNQLNDDSLNILVQIKNKVLTKNNIREKFNAEIINKLKEIPLEAFLKIHVNEIEDNQIQGIEIPNPIISAILIMNRARYVSTEQIHKMFSFGFTQVTEEIRKIEPKNCFGQYLRFSKRFKDIPTNEFNSFLNFSCFHNLKEIIDENLQNNISKENVQNKVHLEQLYEHGNENLLINFISSCAKKLSKRQIQSLDLQNLRILHILIDNNLSNNFSSNQVPTIVFNNLNDQQLKELLVVQYKNFTNDQINDVNIRRILPLINSNTAIQILIDRLNDISREQIRVIKINSMSQIQKLDVTNEKIAYLILANSCFNSLSTEKKNMFNKNILLEYNDSTLRTFINTNIQYEYDFIISGLLIYKFFTHRNDENRNFFERFISRYNNFDDIFFAKLVLIAEEHLPKNAVRFANIANQFSESFDKNRRVITKLSNGKKIQFDYKIFNVTPKEFRKIIWDIFITMNINKVETLIYKQKIFSKLSSDYRDELERIVITYRNADESDVKELSLKRKEEPTSFLGIFRK